VIHPVLVAAAEGELPPWAEATTARREHMKRVAELMTCWASATGSSAEDVIRRRAAAFLHDALRDADPESLRPLVPPSSRNAAGALLHGPAAAARLEAEGVADEPLLLAVAFHTVGHPDLDDLGRSLYVADYVEAGREHSPGRLAALRARMPEDAVAVLAEVAADRLGFQVAARQPLLPTTVAFWNRIVAHD
jgi:HD superfamily phosphohydrolase YqeK